MIESDWRVARMALQIIAEQGPGMIYAREQAREDQQFAETMKVLRG